MPNEGEERQHTISFAEAAARLGVSEQSLKVILEHGFLKARQNAEGQWRIYLDPQFSADMSAGGDAPQPGAASPSSEVEPTIARSEASPGLGSGQSAGQGGDAIRSRRAAGESAAKPPHDDAVPRFRPTLSPLANTLAEERQYLRKQIEQRDATIERKDRLIDELARRLTKLDILDPRVSNPDTSTELKMAENRAGRLGSPNGSAVDRWNRELERRFQELRSLLMRRPQSRT